MMEVKHINGDLSQERMEYLVQLEWDSFVHEMIEEGLDLGDFEEDVDQLKEEFLTRYPTYSKEGLDSLKALWKDPKAKQYTDTFDTFKDDILNCYGIIIY